MPIQLKDSKLTQLNTLQRMLHQFLSIQLNKNKSFIISVGGFQIHLEQKIYVQTPEHQSKP